MNILNLISRIPEFILRVPEFAYRIYVSKKLGLRYMAMIRSRMEIVGAKRMSIGKGFAANRDVRLETYQTEYLADDNSPLLIIGDNCTLNYRTHIGAVNKVVIGNNVLMGSDVLIVDHNHGSSNSMEELSLHPSSRKLHSKGPIFIGDNCWIGDKALIMGGVRIGKGCVIGAGTVVTHDIPDYSVAIGSPARVIKTISN